MNTGTAGTGMSQPSLEKVPSYEQNLKSMVAQTSSRKHAKKKLSMIKKFVQWRSLPLNTRHCARVKKALENMKNMPVAHPESALSS
jgi:hypothetical protein